MIKNPQKMSVFLNAVLTIRIDNVVEYMIMTETGKT